MNTALLIIGDEILNGDTLDTNSNFAAKLLTENGINVNRKLTVGDSKEAIINGLDFLLKEADLVISTGGLGPTRDDITKYTFAEYFGSELVFNEEVHQYLENRYAKRKSVLNDLTKSQAIVPAKSETIINPVGTAPIFWFSQNNKVVVTLPGVPYEMRYLLENIVLEKIKDTFKTESLIHRVIHTVGIPESALAIKLKDIEDEIEKESFTKFKLAYLPSLGSVKLRLTGKGNDGKAISQKLDKWKNEIVEAAGEYIFGYEKDTLAGSIGNLLRDKKATLSTAESCTGGNIAREITSIAGSSDYYFGGVISYDNSIKINELGVKKETLDNFGAVSEEIARKMLSGILKKMGTDYAIVTTGIAGPGGGSEDKPIGTVWIGVGTKDKTIIKKYQFDRSRTENIQLFTSTALDMLRRFVKSYEF